MEPTHPTDPPAHERATPALAPVAGRPFLGRERELAALRTALGRARRAPVVRVLDAPTGVGKSTLLRRFLRDLPAGSLVLRGRSYERGGGALDGVVEALGRHVEALPADEREALARLFPAFVGADVAHAGRLPAPEDPADVRRRGVAALRALLGRLAARGPLVLALDDVQWTDADGAALLHALCRGPDAPPILVVLACRREDLSDAPVLARLLALTCEDEAPLDLAFVHVDALDDALPSDIDGDGIRARLADVGDDARRLLDVLAVAGRPLPRALVLRAAAPTGAAAPPDTARADTGAAEALLTAGLACLGAGDTLEPWHERVREVVLAGLDTAGVRALHGRLAAAYVAEPDPDPEAVARHAVAAGDDAGAAPWCVRAGDAAMRACAFHRASRHYAAAIRGGLDGHDVRVKRAAALTAAGRGAEAAREELAAAAHAEPIAAQRLRGHAALQLLAQGHADEGTAVLVDALARFGLALPKSPWAALASVVWRRAVLQLRGRGFRRRAEADVPAADLARIDTVWAGAIGLSSFDQLRSAELHVRQLLLALRAGEPVRMARALSLELVHTAVAGSRRAAAAERLVAETRAVVDEAGDPRVATAFTRDHGIALFLLGRFAEARPLLERADAELRARPDGAGWERDALARFLARVYAWQGDLPALAAYAGAHVRDADARGDTTIAVQLRLRTEHLLRLRDDDTDGLGDDLDDLHASLARPGFPFPAFVHLLAAAEVELYRDAVGEAWNRVVRTWPTVVKTMVFRVQVSRVEGAWLRGRCALAVLATLPAGDARRGRFEAIAWRERRALTNERVAWAEALGRVLEAVETRVTGKGGAAAMLLSAAGALDAAGMHLHAAAARLRAGEWNGRPDEAARAWMVGRGVVDPERLARVYVPGP